MEFNWVTPVTALLSALFGGLTAIAAQMLANRHERKQRREDREASSADADLAYERAQRDEYRARNSEKAELLLRSLRQLKSDGHAELRKLPQKQRTGLPVDTIILNRAYAQNDYTDAAENRQAIESALEMLQYPYRFELSDKETPAYIKQLSALTAAIELASARVRGEAPDDKWIEQIKLMERQSY